MTWTFPNDYEPRNRVLFTASIASIKSKCVLILLYGVEACPTNSADKQSLQFTMNRVLFKIFGAMAKVSYLEISSHFEIHPLEQYFLRGDNFFEKVQFVGQLFMSADSQTLA